MLPLSGARFDAPSSRRRALLRAGTLTAAALVLAACQDLVAPTAASRDPLLSSGITLTASHAQLRLIVGDTARVGVTATNPAGRGVPFLGTVAWSGSAAGIATVSEDGLVTAIAPGEALAVVAHRNGNWADTVRIVVTYPEEARALWVNRFEWGVTLGEAGAKNTLRAILDSARKANFNIVYLQVRGEGDAYYPSDIEPCTFRLCGALGARQPSWDPLAFAIEEAHARGIQLHAWVNAYTGWSSPAGAGNASYCARLVPSAAGQPNHMLIDHPEWALVSSANVTFTCTNSTAYEYAYVSPGIPAVRTHLARVAADIARRYDVDGIHLDRVRYPSNFLSYDQPSVDAFGRRAGSSDPAWIRWRQDAVSQGVKEVHDSLAAANPRVILSAAVWGIYEDNWGWNSSRGLMQYFQAAREWARDGYLDVAVPMTYYNTHASYCGFADWSCLLDDHMAGYAGTNSHMYIAISPAIPAAKTNAMVLQQVALGRSRGVKGFAFYSWNSMNSRKVWTELADGPFSEPRAVPHMSWR